MQLVLVAIEVLLEYELQSLLKVSDGLLELFAFLEVDLHLVLESPVLLLKGGAALSERI